MAHGFPIEMLEELVSSGNARAEAHRTTSVGCPVTVVWHQISAAGRKVIGMKMAAACVRSRRTPVFDGNPRRFPLDFRRPA
jgi:hypothetical protein